MYSCLQLMSLFLTLADLNFKRPLDFKAWFPYRRKRRGRVPAEVGDAAGTLTMMWFPYRLQRRGRGRVPVISSEGCFCNLIM